MGTCWCFVGGYRWSCCVWCFVLVGFVLLTLLMDIWLCVIFDLMVLHGGYVICDFGGSVDHAF